MKLNPRNQDAVSSALHILEKFRIPKTATKAQVEDALNERAVEISQLRSEMRELNRTLAEADRRAGAAERVLAGLREDVYRMDQCRARQKTEAGYHRNVSFDVVWDEALAAMIEKRGPLPENPQHRL